MEFSSQERHSMTLETVHPSGVEEWYCPTCGRRFLMQLPPAFNRVILEPGDETASHVGGKGGLASPTEVDRVVESGDLTDQESNYAPWLEWMEKSEFDRLWEADLDENL